MGRKETEIVQYFLQMTEKNISFNTTLMILLSTDKPANGVLTINYVMLKNVTE